MYACIHASADPALLIACAQAGFTTVLWSHDSDDCRTESADDIVRGVSGADMPGGSIVLLHEGQSWTLDALPAILHGLKEAGHELVTVGKLPRFTCESSPGTARPGGGCS